MSDKGGKGGLTSGTGLSPFDTQAVSDWLNNAGAATDNRYAQLGLGVPGGNPITAAAGGQSLPNAGPSTANIQDDQGLQTWANAMLGQQQANNISNPALSGGNNTSLASLAGNLASSIGTAALGA